MALNSKREQIILRIIEEVKEIDSIKTVIRKMPAHSDLQEFALTQLPVVAVVGRLPVPKEHISGRRPAKADQMISDLKIDLFVYIQDKNNPDGAVSNILDDLWVKLNADQTKGDLVLSTLLQMTEHPEYWAPFVAFNISCNFTYVHTIGGI